MRTDRRALARVLVADWEAGAERVWYGQLPDDVADTADLASTLDDLDRSPWDRHGRLLRASLLLDPALPPIYRGTLVAPEHLAELAAAAVRGGTGSSAYEVLSSLRDQEVLTAVGELTGAAWAHRLAREWAGARREADALMAAHAHGSSAVTAELRTHGDAWLLELLVEPDARSRILAQLAAVEGGERLPAWFRAARSPDASVPSLLIASLLIGQVRREVLAGEDRGAEPSSDAASDASSSAADDRSGGRRRGPVPADHRDAADDRDRQDADRLLERSVAVGVASVVAAAALWWPIVTSLAVLAWLVVDRTVSWIADPFLRLVGGWPPRVRGWAVAWLPLRVVGLVLRAPWRLLGDVLLLVLSVVLVDRLLAAGHLAVGWVVEGGIGTPRDGFVARWFAPVWCGFAVWLATRRWPGGPPLRGAGLVAGSLRRTPMAVRASFLAVSVLLVITAGVTPAADPWAPHDDHRAAMLAWLPFGDAIERFTDGREPLLGDPELPSLFDDEPDIGAADDGDAGDRAAPDAVRWQVVGVAGLNVRAGPGTAYEVVGSLAGGATAVGLGPSQDVDGATWVQVRLVDGTVGWASGRYLDQVAP